MSHDPSDELVLRPRVHPASDDCPPLEDEELAFLERLLSNLPADGFWRLSCAEATAADLDLIVRLASKGLLEVGFLDAAHPPDPLQDALDALERSGRARPEIWNRIAYEKEWSLYGDTLDSLEPSSPFFEEARIQRQIYLDAFEPYLERLPCASLVLDAGCGVGRFATLLAKRGHGLVCVDRSRGAILRCMRRLAQTGRTGSVRFWMGDCSDLPRDLAGPFAAVLAIELLPYVRDPTRTLARLVELCAPGGLLFLSVENRHGALLAHPPVPPEKVPSLLATGLDCRRHHLFARLMLRDEFERLLGNAGLEVLRLGPILHTAGGIFHATFEALKGTEEGRTALLDLEWECSGDPILAPLGRVWAAVARKKG